MKKRKSSGKVKRPPKKELIELLFQNYGNITAIARIIGATPQAVRLWVNKYDLSETLEESRDSLLDVAEYGLAKRVEAQDPKMIMYLLDSRGQKRGYGTFKTINTGEDATHLEAVVQVIRQVVKKNDTETESELGV